VNVSKTTVWIKYGQTLTSRPFVDGESKSDDSCKFSIGGPRTPKMAIELEMMVLQGLQ